MTDRQNEKKKLMAHLAAVVRDARKRAELTQADVAERVGVVTEVFGRLERGYLLPSVPTLRKLCRALGVDANAILGLDAEKAPLLKAPEREADDPPELRRLVRTLRRMDSAQLAVMSSTANALMRHTAQQPDDQTK
ncbi:helix-turn-helix domain-containing protein [Archangium gephyra]|uniref:helix-turn-helix domain-containing protein n=1 Tax=Archangium gephyra TaxID=48 RepID=UPI0006492A38|nr:helix-turn-helix domain-containing protein [Archangium gephyra]